MSTVILFTKNFKYHLVAGGIGCLATLGLMGQVRADDPVSSSTNNAIAPAAPGTAATKGASTGTKPAANTPAPTSITPPASKSGNQDIGGLSIDELLNVTVTSAGQKEQKLSDVAAAMTVLNSDDIRRSGATNIPDLLRYIPATASPSAVLAVFMPASCLF